MLLLFEKHFAATAATFSMMESFEAEVRAVFQSDSGGWVALWAEGDGGQRQRLSPVEGERGH